MKTTTVTTWCLAGCTILWLLAAVTSAAISFSWSTLLPRMPEYYFRVTSWPSWWWFWTSGYVQIPSYVSLFNENIFPVDVHAMSIDLYYPTWGNRWMELEDDDHKDDKTGASSSSIASSPSLIHIGHVIDKQQHEQKVLLLQQQNSTPCYYHHGGMLRCDGDDEDDEDGNEHPRLLLTSPSDFVAPPSSSTTTTTSSSAAASAGAHRNNNATKAPPPNILWSVPARASFATDDDIFVSTSTLSSWTSVLYHGVAQMAWNVLYHGKSTLYIPSTGVLYVHAKALNQRVPLTIGIVCDNALAVWTMELRGINCVMHSIDLGWWPMDAHVSQIRNMAMYEWLPVNATIKSSATTLTASIVPRKRRKRSIRKPVMAAMP